MAHPRFSCDLTPDLIPDELKAEDRWVVWKLVPSKSQAEKFHKVPYDAKTSRRASSNDPTTWSSFHVALTGFRTGSYDGVGFQLGDGFAGIDLDNCIDPKTGFLADWALEIVDRLKTYTETSPSGNGLKCFLKGKLPPGRHRQDLPNGRIEFYDSGQFFTVTGQRFEKISEIRSCNRDLNTFYDQYCGKPKPIEHKSPPSTEKIDRGIEPLVRRIHDMPEGSGLKRLFCLGDWGGKYATQSEADLALCSMLALRFGCDAAIIDSLFRTSRLFRPKWDESHSSDGRTYGRMTVAKAIATASREFRKQFDIRTPHELQDRARDLGRNPFIVEGLLPARSLALLAGDSGVGKSPLLYQLALCVASGIPFLGHKVRRGRVLYLDFENGVNQVNSLVNRLARHLGLKELPKELNFWNRNDSTQEDVTRAIQSVIKKLKPTLVIVDSLGSYAPTIESKNPVANQTLQMLRGVIRDSGATIILVHHLRKESRKRGETSEPLEGDLHRWFQEVRGPRAIINGSNVRLGVAVPRSAKTVAAPNGQSEITFVLRGFAHVQGEIPMAYIARSLDSEGEPLGYKKLCGVELLRNPEQETLFHRLPPTFRFKNAKFMYGKGDQPTADFLKKCIALGILRKASSGYEKITEPVPSEGKIDVQLVQ